ncbi:SixA phosphatase family protein [Litorimonas sp. RW-G-Af-16]|uniref:SixA phosphatase family protein n=1 Tax=Litorimonas sp. RW-G-Af-16 TaxID=3241168 RepID=UPI00390CBBF0
MMTHRQIISARILGGACALLGVLILAACEPIVETSDPAVATTQAPLEVFLVRHAEKTTAKDDPALTEAGAARADLLADMLIDAKITRIHSSDYTRTRDTAAPLADRLGLEIEIYDPSDLPAMSAKLQAAGGRHLVVGHSNTTGELTELLGGEGGDPIVEAYEYDRLYLVTTAADGSTTSALLRFGESGR